MNKEDIFAIVVAIIADKLGCEISEISEETDFATDLGCDSLDAVEILMEFEYKFHISIPDVEFDNLVVNNDISMKTIVDYLYDKVNKTFEDTTVAVELQQILNAASLVTLNTVVDHISIAFMNKYEITAEELRDIVQPVLAEFGLLEQYKNSAFNKD